MATINLPRTLTRFTNELVSFNTNATTFGSAMVDLLQTFPELRGQLFDENLRLRVYVNVIMDQELVRLPDDFNTPITSDTIIRIFQNIAGG